MTAAIEYAVRPASSPNPHGSTIIAATPGATRERATLTWGAQATMPVPSSAVTVTCCKEDLTEADREGETVRITQPGNSDNYIDVFRSNKVHLSKKAKNPDCSSDQNSDNAAGQAVADALAELGAIIEQIDSEVTGGAFDNQESCKITWNLKNNTAAP